MKKQYIFGPVPSRRLGRSLGIDLVPFKTCSYDCTYCQLGRTTNKTIEMKQWFPVDGIIEQLKEKLSMKPDYITLSGSGEPTLFLKCDELITRIKQITNVPVAVLTNGSLLWRPQVRKSLMQADLIVPSLDAGSERLFKYINRPHDDISFADMLEGLINLRKEYNGQYWLEVFILAGVNTTEVEIDRLKDCIHLINPDKVQLNTVTRPPAESFAEPVSFDYLTKIAADIFKHSEVIADNKEIHQIQEFTVRRKDVLELLNRRPCSVEDISAGLSLHINEVVKYIAELRNEGKIKPMNVGAKIYYKAIIENTI